MENNWLTVKAAALASWQTKINLKLANKPQTKECYILATNDLEAIQFWEQQCRNMLTILRVYQKEVDGLLLWCSFEKGLGLGELKVEKQPTLLLYIKNPKNDNFK